MRAALPLRIALLGAACVLNIGVAQAETRSVNAGLVASAIEGAFRGTQLRLNNYGPRHGDSWHKANDSFLRMSATLGGGERRFDIPEVVIRARVKVPLLPDPKYTARYYISDVNLASVAVAPAGGTFKITMRFESNGTELKGRCSDGCVVGSDDTAPDFQINGARVDVFLTPAALDGSVSYGAARPEFHGHVDGSGLGEFFENKVKREIKNRLEPTIAGKLNEATVRHQVAAATRATLNRLGIGRVNSVRMIGGNLVIDHTPPRS